MATRRLHVVVRPRAQADVDAAIDHYLVEAGIDVAERFGDALTKAFELLSRNPGIGSLRYADAVAMPGLRAWPLRPWPHTVFYVPGEKTIDVVRVLHGARDIPASLAEPSRDPNPR